MDFWRFLAAIHISKTN